MLCEWTVLVQAAAASAPSGNLLVPWVSVSSRRPFHTLGRYFLLGRRMDLVREGSRCVMEHRKLEAQSQLDENIADPSHGY